MKWRILSSKDALLELPFVAFVLLIEITNFYCFIHQQLISVIIFFWLNIEFPLSRSFLLLIIIMQRAQKGGKLVIMFST